MVLAMQLRNLFGSERKPSQSGTLDRMFGRRTMNLGRAASKLKDKSDKSDPPQGQTSSFSSTATPSKVPRRVAMPSQSMAGMYSTTYVRTGGGGSNNNGGHPRREQNLSGKLWIRRSSFRTQKRRFNGGKWTKDDFLFSNDENEDPNDYNIDPPTSFNTTITTAAAEADYLDASAPDFLLYTCPRPPDRENCRSGIHESPKLSSFSVNEYSFHRRCSSQRLPARKHT